MTAPVGRVSVPSALGSLFERVRILEAATAEPFVSDDYAKVSDQKTQNTGGGTFTSGAWRTRTINTEDSDSSGIVTIASNQITLVAGTYICSITVPAYEVARHQARLFNVTDTSLVLTGSSEISFSADTTNTSSSESHICGMFTIAASKALEVQHRCQTTKATIGFGVEGNFGVEVYTQAEFWKQRV